MSKTARALSENREDVEMGQASSAAEFYGAAYKSAKNPSKLDDAFKWIGKACVFDSAGDDVKTQMALKAALKAEADGLGHEPDLTNLAA